MMTYKGYAGKVEFDDDAKILHGEVLGIRDVVTFQAESSSEIELAFHDSVDDYLALCKERGEQPGKPFSGQFLVRVDSQLHRHLTIIAQMSGKSLNTVVAEFLANQAANTPLSPPSNKSRRRTAVGRKTIGRKIATG